MLEGNPAPNHYYPKMDPVLKKAPQPSFKRRTHFGRPDNVTPSPNKYTLQTGYPKPCKKSPCGSIKPRFQQKSEGNPAPNIYHVPSTAKYKYGKTAAITMTPIREPVIKADSVPPPNLYSSQAGVQCSIKSPLFGQKSSYKRAVYMTVEDFI
ncbi:Hypothetical protein CINCED_3A016990 [Cinara cedri]|uniref:Uncharacterized protein n=1 Tax=Cinara cedri TaxID=506608 RepID=A0A5E4N4G8_9HEMI|nr:Hypothetical protein CINCED_3A016990 [Cinara cedri]